MLPYFSMIAIISLGVISVSGLYMAWLQLQSIGSLFESSYGNILILKLCVIVPMILLGAYHQIKLHYVMDVLLKEEIRHKNNLKSIQIPNRERLGIRTLKEEDFMIPSRGFPKRLKLSL